LNEAENSPILTNPQSLFDFQKGEALVFLESFDFGDSFDGGQVIKTKSSSSLCRWRQ
jgi:hypothetical protein